MYLKFSVFVSLWLMQHHKKKTAESDYSLRHVMSVRPCRQRRFQEGRLPWNI